MLLLKRIAAGIINFLLFYSLYIGLKYIFGIINVNLGNDLFGLIAYICVYVFAIIIFDRTVGYQIFKINYEDKDKFQKINLIAKYAIYYLVIFDFTVYGLFNFIVSILGHYTYIELSGMVPARLYMGLIILICISLFFSAGKYNIVDYLLSIKIREYGFKKKFYILHMYYIVFIFIFFASGLILYRLNLGPNLMIMMDKMSKDISRNYFPPEIFDNYAYSVHSTYEKTNDIITLSDISSLFLNKNLLMQTVYVNMKHDTFIDVEKRFMLCKKILEYSIYDLFGNYQELKDLMQTKFIFVYTENHTTYNIEYKYTYYFDHKFPQYSIYSINLDTLKNMYAEIHNDYMKNYWKTLSRELNIPIDTIRKYYFDGTRYDFPDYIIDSVKNKSFSFEYSATDNIDINKYIQISTFDSTKAEKYVKLILGFPISEDKVTAFKYEYRAIKGDGESVFDIKKKYVFSR